MDLLKIYNEVDAVLKTVDFSALFAGFHPYNYALYNNKEICLVGEILPYQEDFKGNTAIEHNGEYIAIWNMEGYISRNSEDGAFTTEILLPQV